MDSYLQLLAGQTTLLRAYPVVGGENPVAACAFQPVTSGRDARAPREGAVWERGRPACILSLRDALPYGLKVFYQTLTH